MTRSFIWMGLVLLASPGFAWLVYRLARELGFLDLPRDREQELRRTIVIALYALLLFLPVLYYGFEKRWPPAWKIFGSIVTLALVIFAAAGIWSARQIWKIRHPEPSLSTREPPSGEPVDAALAAAATHSAATPEPPAHASDPPRPPGL